MQTNMKVKELIDKTMRVFGKDDCEISNLSHNSKEIRENGLFFAIHGTKVNGEDFVQEAIKNGAICIVSENKLDLPDDICQIVCPDSRKAMSIIASNFYGNASKDMFIIAVTGTNGKTTSTYMLASVFKNAGKKVGIIGTNGIFIDKQNIDHNLTTPDPIDLQKTFAIFKESGVQVVCMELSAHALELQKNWGVMTDIALFTNLTQDHLDFFNTMENYGKAKAKLFTKDFAKMAVINADDDFGFSLFKGIKIPAIAYGRQKSQKTERLANCNVVALSEHLLENMPGQDFVVKVFGKEQKIHINLDGGFNVSNALGVVGAGYLAGLSLKIIAGGLGKLESVDGRFNTYLINGVKVIIDYAHTPDGLLNILHAARELAEGKRVIAVFGCGGNRDMTKRKIMGAIACKNADFSMITSDNPRFEAPESIASQIKEGFSENNYKVIIDRKQAIKEAIKIANSGDVVVIAGKGAENYLDVNGEKIFYSDKGTVEELKEEFEAHTNKK